MRLSDFADELIAMLDRVASGELAHDDHLRARKMAYLLRNLLGKQTAEDISLSKQLAQGVTGAIFDKFWPQHPKP